MKLNEVINTYFGRRAAPYWCVLLADSLIVLFSGLFGFFLLYGIVQVADMFWQALFSVALFLPGYILGFRLFHTYSGILRYSTVTDFIRVGGAMLVGFVCSILIHSLKVCCRFGGAMQRLCGGAV